jgi:hypothetical protein
MPTPDDINRDKFYSNHSDDDADYELEPLDEEILAVEKQRAEETIAASRTAIDVDQIYRDLDERQDGGVIGEWLRGFQSGFRGGFHFQVKHLLIATAVLAIALTLRRLGQLLEFVSLATVGGIIGLYLYSQWKENQLRAEADHKREAMYARRRAYFDKSRPSDASLADEVTTATAATGPLTPSVDDAFHEALAKPKFRFQFSLKQLMTAMIVSAFILGLVRFFGGSAPTATMLGVVALGGLVIHAIGYEPPEIVVLGWWLLLVLYVLLSFAGVVWSGA